MLRISLIFFLIASIAHADPAIHREAIELVQRKQPEAAADIWLEEGEILERSARDNSELYDAAFYFVLASMALDKANSRDAIQAWGFAQRLYNEAETTWEERRNILSLRIENLTAAASSRQGYRPDDEEAALLDIEELFALSSYNGPRDRENIRDTYPRAARAPYPDHESRSYYPRPKSNQDSRKTRNDDYTPRVSNRGLRNTRDNDNRNPYESDIEPRDRRSIFDRKGRRYQRDDRDNDEKPRSQFRATRTYDGISRAEEEITKAAWNYIDKNIDDRTGLIPPIKDATSFSAMDLGDMIMAQIAAHQLDISSRNNFNHNIKALLRTLVTLPLYKDELPNRLYSLKDKAMLDSSNNASSDGSGWDAIDVAHLMTSLELLLAYYPDYRNTVEVIQKRLNADRMTLDNELSSLFYDGTSEKLIQDTRFGMEQYALEGLYAANIISRVKDPSEHLLNRMVDGVEVTYDTRENATLTADGFLLYNVMFGDKSRPIQTGWLGIYDAMRSRYEDNRILTASCQGYADTKPYYRYNNILIDGESFIATAQDGSTIRNGHGWCTKTAIGIYTVMNDSYGKTLFQEVFDKLVERDGLANGVYDNKKINSSQTLSTNTFALLAMWYKQLGRGLLE